MKGDPLTKAELVTKLADVPDDATLYAEAFTEGIYGSVRFEVTSAGVYSFDGNNWVILNLRSTRGQ